MQKCAEMKTKLIEFDNGDVQARIEVGEATVLMGARRSRLRFEADGENDPDRKLVRLFVYPDLIAAAKAINVSGIDGVPTFDQFLQLPEALVAQWESATFDLNPHWLPSEPDEKKAES